MCRVFEVIVATHLYADHTWGLIEVMDTYQVDEIWHNEEGTDAATYRVFMDRVRSFNSTRDPGAVTRSALHCFERDSFC